jgi:hypothetical protein
MLLAAKPGVRWEVKVLYGGEVSRGAMEKAEAEGKEVNGAFEVRLERRSWRRVGRFWGDFEMERWLLRTTRGPESRRPFDPGSPPRLRHGSPRLPTRWGINPFDGWSRGADVGGPGPANE